MHVSVCLVIVYGALFIVLLEHFEKKLSDKNEKFHIEVMTYDITLLYQLKSIAAPNGPQLDQLASIQDKIGE